MRAQNDVSSLNDYLGVESVTVPAFPQPVVAAKIRSQITQAGALGDPYGSGVRTTWWVYGVGPVKIVFQHAGGSGAPITTAVLQATNQTAKAPPPDAQYFPLRVGVKGTYRWTNTKHFKKPEVEKFTIDQAANGTAIAKFSSVSGPMKVAGAYQFTTRLDGLTSVSSATKAASLAKLPPLGPSSLPANKRRHFFTPFDLMTYGFGPVLPAYPTVGTTWSSDPGSRDFSVYGVNGSTKMIGVQQGEGPGGDVRRARRLERTEAARIPVRQRHAHDVVRAGQGPRETPVPTRRRQRVRRGTTALSRMDRRTVALRHRGSRSCRLHRDDGPDTA